MKHWRRVPHGWPRRLVRGTRTAVGALGLVGGLLSVTALKAVPGTGTASAASGTTATATDSLPRDPALVVGTLPNGLRYYIRAHRSPAKRAALWLAVNAGSLQEDDDQQGLAHFLEHMAFNGTRNFPRHELISTLQLAGMRFGADINAYTSFDETVYMLEVPTDDGRSLDQGLTMLADWASGGILIDSLEVVAERGVVMGEWRFRTTDTTSRAVQRHMTAVLFGDSRYRDREPIGRTDLLERAEPEPLRRFYRDWYRPDLMAVIAVGDFDPTAMEREIRARFGGITGPTAPRPREVYHLPSHDEPVIDVYRGWVSPGITVYWKRPAQTIATCAAYRQALVEQLLIGVVQARLQQLAVQPQRPFFGAGFGLGRLVRATEAFQLAVVGGPTDSLERGLATALAELERIAQHGVPAAVLERRKAALLRQLESQAAQSDALPATSYAQEYVNHYLQGGALWSAAQQLAVARELLPTITSADLARAAQFWRTGRSRITRVDFPVLEAVERVPTAAGIAAIFDSVARLQLAPDSAAAVLDQPLLAKLPKPGRITAERRHLEAGITEWTLSNGARVLVKPTFVNPDEVLIRAVSPGGWALLPDTLFFSPGRLVAQMMTQAAGLGDRDRQTLGEHLSTRVLREYVVELTPYQEGMRLGGSPRDVEALLQLLYLQFTAPKLDTVALSLWKRSGSLQGSYSGDDDLAYTLSGANPRLALPSAALMALADTGRALAVFRDRFGNAADFTFIIVGAVTPQQVRPLVERYVASLPSTGVRETAPDLGVRPLERRIASTAKVFDLPRAQTSLLYAGEFPSTVEEYLTERRRLSALGILLQMRFTDVLREQMGGTYGAGVSTWTTAVPQEHYRFVINFVAAPERIHGMLDTTFAVLDSVRAYGASEVELRKVAAIQRRLWETSLQDNRYWLEQIELFDRLKIPLARLMEPPGARTSEEIRAAVERYLPTTAYVNQVLLPNDDVLAEESDSPVAARGDARPSVSPPRCAGAARESARGRRPC